MNQDLTTITRAIIGSGFHVHNSTGPGLLESVYESLLADDLFLKGYFVERQKKITLKVNGREFRKAFRVDLMVANQVIVEVKSADAFTRVDAKQLLTYLKLMDLRVGLLLNFGAASLQIKRLVNHF